MSHMESRHRDRWLRANPWYGSSRHPELTEWARGMDARMFRDPDWRHQVNTANYWSELDHRLRRLVAPLMRRDPE